MIASLNGLVPPSLAAITDKVAVGAAPTGCSVPWRDAVRFEAALARFGAPYPRPDRRALISLWSQYYLAALIIPATVALLKCDRILPIAADEVHVEIDGDGTIGRLWLRDEGRIFDGSGARWEPLVGGHLRPFVLHCAAVSRLPRRVLWSNAAAILAYALDELAAAPPVIAAAYADGRRLLADDPRQPMGRLLRRAEGGICARRVCCLRYRLAGVPRCAGTCPLD